MNTKLITIDEFKKALQNAANQRGEEGVILQKKLLLDKCMLVDDKGMAVNPDEVDVTMIRRPQDEMAPVGVAAEMEDEKEDAMMYPKNFKKALRDEIRSAIRDEGIEVKSPIVKSVPSALDIPYKKHRLNHLKSAETAFKFGAWAAAACGHVKAKQFCEKNGIILTKQHVEGDARYGGYLVPEEFENELITLREQFGVFRPACKSYPMSRETLRIPRRVSTLEAYFVGEARAGTESRQSFDQVNLVAKKIMVLTTISNELLEDALISVGDDLAGEVAYAFAKKEDECGFLGDGTSPFGGIVGLRNALGTAGSDQRVHDVGLGAAAITPASRTADQTIELLANAVARLPAWAFKMNNVKIYCHKSIWHNLLEPAALKAGGSNAAERVAGISTPKFLGYDVVWTQCLTPASDATDNSTIFFIGDLSQACYFGDRRATTIDFNDAALNAFEQDERAVRATQRFDIVCTNLGTAAAAGPVVHVIR